MGPTSKWHFVLGLPSGSLEISKIATPETLGAHNFACRPSIEMRSKAKLYPLSIDFQWYVANHLHTRKSWQFPTFNGRELNCQFDHNLCFKCPSGSCKPISDINVPRAFQWYKELFNPMNFDPCNRPLKIWKSIKTPIPKMRIHLKVWGFIPSHSFALPGAWVVTPGLPSWPVTLETLALVASPRLGLR
jgi:hypothetical protein